MNQFLKIGLATAIALTATTAFAQASGGVGGPTPGSIVTYAPLPVPGSPSSGAGSAALSPAGAAAIAAAASKLSSGTMTSLAGDAAIPAAAQQNVAAVILSGAPGAVNQLFDALRSSGAQSAQASALANALAALGGSTSSNAGGLIIDAGDAFNALVRSAPAGFFANPPAHFLAVHAALVPIVGAIR